MKNPINYRSLIKQIYRYTHKRTYRHSEKIWPYIGIDRDEQGCICTSRYLGKPIDVVSLEALQSLRADDLVIIGSGPSLAKTDLTALSQADWMCVNGSVSVMHHYPNKALQFYAVIDQGFVQDRIDVIANVLANPQVIFFTNLFCLRKIYELIGHQKVKARVVIYEDRQKAVYLPRFDADEMASRATKEHERLVWRNEQQVGFSLDLCRGYISGGTVVYFALQIAAAMGYKRVFLAGVDMTRFNEPRFYENTQTRLETKLDMEFERAIYPSFALAADIFRQLGIQGYNLCLDSGLDDAIFPRVTVAQALSLQDALEEQ